MQLTDFEAMSFDCYGTLIDWEAGLSAVLTPWARAHGLDLTGEQLLTEYSPIEAAVEADRPADLYPDVLARSMRLLGEKLGAEVTRLGVGPGKLLHVAQSLFHDHVPAKRAGLPTVWINRRHARPGWGATPEPPAPVTPDWEFPSMAAFTAAVESASPHTG